VPRVPLALLLAALPLLAAPGRHIRYAESSDRKVYAFVFGHKDTCRVIRRSTAPRFELDQFLRRPPGASYRGEPTDTLLKEFDFGRGGRPVHLIPTNDGQFLLAFANRAADGSAPESDRVIHLAEDGYTPRIDYSALPKETLPGWPDLKRALAKPKPVEPPGPPVALSYAFAAREIDPGRVLVSRQSEDGRDRIAEMVCFVVVAREGEAKLPAPAECESLLEETEPLFRGGAAWALGHLGERDSVPHLQSALSRTHLGVARAAIGAAIVRCGGRGGRKTLRDLLDEAPSARRAAARALALLPPDKGDADALAEAAADADAETAHYARLALARIGAGGVRALVRLSRSSRPAVRAAAAGVLGRIDDADAERRLLVLARDPEEEVQTAAAVALTRPPRAILPANHSGFARALDACGRFENGRAARRLAILAAHAKIHHEKVLEALVGLASFEPKAIWSLARLTRKELKTAEDCERWWRARDQ